MIFDSNKKTDNAILKLWKYYGKCKDKKGDIWTYYTNSKRQFKDFRNDKKKWGMIFVSGYKNKNYEVVKRLINDM